MSREGPASIKFIVLGLDIANKPADIEEALRVGWHDPCDLTCPFLSRASILGDARPAASEDNVLPMSDSHDATVASVELDLSTTRHPTRLGYGPDEQFALAVPIKEDAPIGQHEHARVSGFHATVGSVYGKRSPLNLGGGRRGAVRQRRTARRDGNKPQHEAETQLRGVQVAHKVQLA